MPSRRINPMAALRSTLGMEDVADPFAWGREFNESIRPSIEHQREANIISGMDARADESFDRDLEQANAVRDARLMGFDGTNPLREQADYTYEQKLRMLLEPKMAEERAGMYNLRATQEFNAGQKALDRQAQMDRLNVAQGGQNTRATERAADMAARAVKPSGSTLRSLFGWLPGIDSNQEVTDAERARVRESVRGQMSNMGGGEETIPMQTPDGRIKRIPLSRVEEMEALGAQRL